MLKRIFINIFLISFLEILFYNIFIFILWKIGLVFHEPVSKNIFWGLSIVYSVYVFSILVLIKNTFEEIFKINKTVLNFVIIIFFSVLIQEFKNLPLRTILLIFSGILALSIKLIFNYKTNLKSKISNLKSKCLYE